MVKLFKEGMADGCLQKQEESPGCSKAGLHLTGGRSNPRASATESRPPKDNL